jgi:hypothetical protein
MRKITVLGLLCLLAGSPPGQAQLKIDFNVTGGAVEAGYQGYFASDKNAATFTAQSYQAFGTTVTIRPTWPADAVAGAMRMIDRGTDDGLDVVNLLRDWIGTDTRSVGDPMTLTISGLPVGTYQWLSYHHDAHDQTGIFSVTVNDATGSATTTGIDITDTRAGAVVKLADVTKFTTTITSYGKSDVQLVFDQTSATPTANAIFVMNAFELTSIDTGVALVPLPDNQATDVLRDGTVLSWLAHPRAVAHDVYLGTDSDGIDDGTTASAVYRGRQDANTFDPGRLEFGRKYFWRVDEVTSAGMLSKGSIWSFTVEPASIPLTRAQITVTASSSNSADEGPEKTVDGSGLDADGLHSVDTAAMWVSSPAGAPPIWIQYEFDRVYLLQELWVWNYNVEYESVVGYGFKDVTIEYSLDGTTWTARSDVRFDQAASQPGYAHNTPVALGGIRARYVRLTARSNWSTINLKQCGLSEIRFFVIPVSVREPQPASGATGVNPGAALSWRAGRLADQHQVYLSTDVNEVVDGTALLDTIAEPRLDAAGLLELGRTYYWKVNEVNDLEDPPVWEGETWNFSTSATRSVDDMESYNDEADQGTRIYEVWLDGWDDPAHNGSQVGHTDPPFAELTTVHGGAQSMPFTYDGTTASYSEGVRTFDEPQDWTAYGAKALTLWFYGDPTNTTAQMYLKVNGRKVAYDGDPADLLRKPWQMWYIDLGGLTGVNLKKVTELTLGFEGGQGQVFFDDIALSPAERRLVTPVQPDATGLVAHYAFEGNTNDSAGGPAGTVGGAPTFVPGKVGQAIKLNGATDYVLVTRSVDLPEYSAALWFRVEGGTGNRDLVSIFNDTALHGALLEVASAGELRFLHRAPVGSTGADMNIRNYSKFDDGKWYHAAIVKSADRATLYINGAPAGSAASTTPFDQALTQIALGMLKYPIVATDTRYLPGELDEVYLYRRALSQEEVAWLAGRTMPFDEP